MGAQNVCETLDYRPPVVAAEKILLHLFADKASSHIFLSLLKRFCNKCDIRYQNILQALFSCLKNIMAFVLLS